MLQINILTMMSTLRRKQPIWVFGLLLVSLFYFVYVNHNTEKSQDLPVSNVVNFTRSNLKFMESVSDSVSVCVSVFVCLTIHAVIPVR